MNLKRTNCMLQDFDNGIYISEYLKYKKSLDILNEVIIVLDDTLLGMSMDCYKEYIEKDVDDDIKIIGGKKCLELSI